MVRLALTGTEPRDRAAVLNAVAGIIRAISDASQVDVVLASKWRPLWDAADTVLPVAFGQIGNRTDAAMPILLERLVSTHFGRIPTRGAEAALLLDLEPDILRADQSVLTPVLDCLAGGTPAGPWRQWRCCGRPWSRWGASPLGG